MTKNLTQDQITKLAYAIGKKTLTCFNKITVKELAKIKNSDKIDLCDYISLILTVLSNFDCNILMSIRDVYKTKTNEEIDFIQMMKSYLGTINATMIKDDIKRSASAKIH